MNKPPAFQFYAKDFLTGTLTMTLAERGLYMTLLAYQWDTGGIPDNLTLIARIASCHRSDVARVWPAVSKKLKKKNDGTLANEKLGSQYEDLIRLREIASKNGQVGANKRWQGLSRKDSSSIFISDLHKEKRSARGETEQMRRTKEMKRLIQEGVSIEEAARRVGYR